MVRLGSLSSQARAMSPLSRAAAVVRPASWKMSRTASREPERARHRHPFHVDPCGDAATAGVKPCR